MKRSEKFKKQSKKKWKVLGRPRLEGKIREPNGRISRAKNPPDAHPLRVALEARAKHTGIDLKDAADPRAETYLGRLAILGRDEGLSRDQHDAAIRFLEIRNDYRRSLLSPGAVYEGTGLRPCHEEDEDYAAWVKRAQRRYASSLKAVSEAQFDNGRENLYAALQYVIIDGLALPHLLGATRMVLNALHRHFKKYGKS